MKTNIIKFSIGVLMIVSLYFIIPSDKDGFCKYQKEFNKKEFLGLIVRKFYDHAQHSVPLIILRNLKNKSVDTIDFAGDTSSVFTNLTESDTIYKKANSNAILLKVNGNLKKVGNVDFDCKDK